MNRFESYRPESLIELSDTDVDDIDIEGQNELIELVLLESKETLKALACEVNNMDEEIFSLDSFYEIQAVISEYKQLLIELEITDKVSDEYLNDLLSRLESKNPISEVAKNNKNNVLVHSSDITSLQNLLNVEHDISEVCTTAGSLQKRGDIFRPKKKSIHAGIIFDPQQASTWFSRDVGSHTSRGKRVLEERFELFKCTSIDEALERQSGERIEAWVDTQTARPIALLLIDPDRKNKVIQLAKQYNLPVLFNSHLYE